MAQALESQPGWPEAPELIEEIYNFEDALVVGGALITMINNADRVKAACLAQLVNVIGPIMTEKGGPAWRQTIFHPFCQAARFASGDVLKTRIDCETFSAGSHEALPCILACVSTDEAKNSTTILALNRHTDETEVSVELRGFGKSLRLAFASELHHRDLKAINTAASPEVTPKELSDVTLSGSMVLARLKPLSWNVIVVARD